jgi:hypothetical protein
MFFKPLVCQLEKWGKGLVRSLEHWEIKHFRGKMRKAVAPGNSKQGKGSVQLTSSLGLLVL